jgi:hypothetical protein
MRNYTIHTFPKYYGHQAKVVQMGEMCGTQEMRNVNTGLVGKIEWYGILHKHEMIILKTDAKIQCIDCRMNSTDSEHRVVVRSHKQSYDSFG